MKNLKIKLPFLALLLGLGIIFTQSAFTVAPVKRAVTYWFFNSSDPSDIRVGTQYSHIINPDPVSCPTGTDLPCVLEVDESIDTQPELNTYLNNMTTFPTDANITASALRKKLGD
ncbi:DUF6520 family protein [Pedobacter mucosus]|uniref:DUF6520 family protein n=1 Tax=Pedobacter mucosus TaxID=2895286 RepID=UPI001EE499BA|nr:DUF6520 family protein [Pedobacter mucosus]UKT65051.1 DUF6520 family protein [Pedobacter mucosus]